MCVHHHTTGGLGPASEATLFTRAQAGCPDSLNSLMECHDGLGQAVVRQQALGDLSFDEALRAGRAGLWHAILGFDPSRDLAFSTPSSFEYVGANSLFLRDGLELGPPFLCSLSHATIRRRYLSRNGSAPQEITRVDLLAE